MTEGPSFLLAVAWRLFSEAILLYLGSSDVIVYFIKFTRSFISSNLLRPSLMYHNAIIGLMYPHFGHVLFVKSKSQLSLTVQGKGLHKVVNTRKSGNSVHH